MSSLKSTIIMHLFQNMGKKPTKGEMLEKKNHRTLACNSDDYLLTNFFLPIFYSVIE